MNRKVLIIVLALLLVLGGVYGYMVLTEEPEEEKDYSASGGQYVLSDIDPMTVMHMTVTRPDSELNFKYTVNGWIVEGNEEYPLDQDIMEETVKNICNVTSERLLTSDRSTFAQYGLDPALVRVELEDSEGNKYVYNIGEKHAATSKFYFNAGGSDDVYTVPTLVGRNFQNYPTLASLMKLPMFPTNKADTTSSIEMTYGGETVKIVHLPDGDPQSYGDYTWFVDGGGALLPLSDDFLSFEGAFEGMGFASGVDFGDDAATLAKYGLDSDYITYAISYTSASRGDVTDKIYFGRGEDGACYALLDGRKEIGRMAVGFDFLIFKYENYKALDFFRLASETIDTMTISLGDSRYVIKAQHSLDGDGRDTAVYTCGGQTLNSAAVEDMLGQMREVRAESESPVGASSAQPYIEMVFDRNTDSYKQMTLRLWQYDSSFYLAEFADNHLLINKLDAEKLAQTIEETVNSRAQ